MALWHLSPVHPGEQVLTVLLALGPFLLLAVAVVVRRRRDARSAHEEAGLQVNTGTVEPPRSTRS